MTTTARRCHRTPRLHAALLVLFAACPASAGVGEQQVKTDHPWYPGELA